ncbi:MAG: AAA family ATPase [Albidovulum sp.]|nr:AAA family ATPase [Albidovulum sp.]
MRHTPRNLACLSNAAISIVRFDGRFRYTPRANRYYARAQDAVDTNLKPLKRAWAGWKQNPLSRSASLKDCCARSRKFAGKHPQTLIRDTSVSPDNRSDARTRAGIRFIVSVCSIIRYGPWFGHDFHRERKMDEVTVENFRCFRKRQTARLAPLTLLVGENSTGKTSLMAMIRILWHAVFRGVVRPDFKEEPFDLGSFREIVHQSESDSDHEQEFSGAIVVENTKTEVTLCQGDISTEVNRLHITDSKASLIWTRSREGHVTMDAQTLRGRWQFNIVEPDSRELEFEILRRSESWGLQSVVNFLKTDPLPGPGIDQAQFSDQDRRQLTDLVLNFYQQMANKIGTDMLFNVPHAIAPIRSEPRRSYEPGPGFNDPKGASIPEYLASLATSDPERWNTLKSGIETFAQSTGVFDEIRIRPLGIEAGSDPFQIQVRNRSEITEGRWRNLIDVGYGASQILPVIYELNQPDQSPMLLLQQPEVHLHPSAQAGLGSIMCNVASAKRQILVETHSDHLIDRVRMDVRDGRTDLKPDDVSILFFERHGEEVEIHSIGIDKEGNILDAPSSYRQFFMDEVNRSLGL